MTQNVANDLGCRAELELATSMGVPEHMGTEKGSCDAGPARCGMQNMTDGYRTRQRLKGGCASSRRDAGSSYAGVARTEDS
jgi:hypothetical protein